MADYDGNREKFKPAKISANLQAAIDRIEEALIEWVSFDRASLVVHARGYTGGGFLSRDLG